MPQFNFDLNELLKTIRREWYQPSTLVILLIIAGGILLWFFSTVNIERISLFNVVAVVVVLALLILGWFLSRRVPQAKKGRVGFAVAISSETKLQYERLAQDFLDILRELLAQGNLKYSFSFIVFPAYYAQKVKTIDDAKEYLRISNCHFMLFGKARIRTIEGQARHVLDLRGIVAHKPIPREVGSKFAAEFSELLPPQILIGQENDLFAFEFTSSWVNLVARYIIGIASLISGDLEYAQSLFEDLRRTLGQQQTEFPAVIKIQQRLPKRLIDVYTWQARLAHSQWRKTRNLDSLNQTKAYADLLQKVDRNNYEAHILRAIWHFVINRDVQSALVEIHKCKGHRDATWRYSDAFLHAYQGEMTKALTKYRAAFKHDLDLSVPFEVEEFISWVLEQEPDKVQLHFCLGLINFFPKGDWDTALHDFEAFLQLCPIDQFIEPRRLAGEYIKTIRGRVQQESS